jgi:hypothetical protein
MILVDEEPDESLVSHFLERYKFVNGCLRERSGPGRDTCVCNTEDAILWADIAASHKLQEYRVWAQLWRQLWTEGRLPINRVLFWEEQRNGKELWMWLRPFWLDPLLDGKIGTPRHPDE